MTDVKKESWLIEWYNNEQYYEETHQVEADNELDARNTIATWLSAMTIEEMTNRGLTNVNLAVSPESTIFNFDTTEITQQKEQDWKAAREADKEKAERDLFEQLKRKYEGGKVNNDD